MFLRHSASKLASICRSAFLSYPKKIQCNVCDWEGRRFSSDAWHVHVNCPRCRAEVRHRLFFAALQNMERFSVERLFQGKTILHIAPEGTVISDRIRKGSKTYLTADLLRSDCDLKLDLCNMREIGNESFDVVIAFDVLEHVPDYRKALEEIRRVLNSRGHGIFTVPQKDHLKATYEDAAIVEPRDRLKHFGQSDHLRIFGDDFPNTVEGKGFVVTAVDETAFSEQIRNRNVLLPPRLSRHPLATNYRKVFFCQKT